MLLRVQRIWSLRISPMSFWFDEYRLNKKQVESNFHFSPVPYSAFLFFVRTDSALSVFCYLVIVTSAFDGISRCPFTYFLIIIRESCNFWECLSSEQGRLLLVCESIY